MKISLVFGIVEFSPYLRGLGAVRGSALSLRRGQWKAWRPLMKRFSSRLLEQRLALSWLTFLIIWNNQPQACWELRMFVDETHPGSKRSLRRTADCNTRMAVDVFQSPRKTKDAT